MESSKLDFGGFARRWTLDEFDHKPIVHFPLTDFTSSNLANNNNNCNNNFNNNNNNYNNNNCKDNCEGLEVERRFGLVNGLIGREEHLSVRREVENEFKSSQNDFKCPQSEVKGLSWESGLELAEKELGEGKLKLIVAILKLNKRVRAFVGNEEEREEVKGDKRGQMEEDLKVFKRKNWEKDVQVPITFKVKRIKRGQLVPVFGQFTGSVIRVNWISGEALGLSVNGLSEILRFGEEVLLISQRYLNC